MPSYPGFLGGSGATQSVTFDQERTVNLYLEANQAPGARSPLALLPTPGFTAFAGATQGITDVGGRALWADVVSGTERCFAVVGASLYELFTDGTVTKRGTVAQDSNPATISYNGLGGQLFITSGTHGYCYVLATNVLTQVLTGEATMGGFAHGYFLAFNRTNGKVRESNLNDGTTWDPTQYFQRSLFADPWQAMFVDANALIWLPGTKTFEVWYDTGASPQPFAPLSGLVGPYGIASPFAFGQAGGTILWLSRNQEGAGLVVSLHGGSPQAISTYAVAQAVDTYQRMNTITTTETLVYQMAGHTFATFSVPTAPATWAFDVDQPSWTERGVWNATTGTYALWSPRVHGYAFGKHLVGDRTTGTIAVMDPTVSTELTGAGIRRLRRAPALRQELQRLPLDRFELLCDVGVGTSGQGADPQVMLRVSGNGGQTWGNERQAGIGRLGEFRRRVYWNRLGAHRDPVLEVTMTDPVPLRLVDAYLNNTAEAA